MLCHRVFLMWLRKQNVSMPMAKMEWRNKVIMERKGTESLDYIE